MVPANAAVINQCHSTDLLLCDEKSCQSHTGHGRSQPFDILKCFVFRAQIVLGVSNDWSLSNKLRFVLNTRMMTVYKHVRPNTTTSMQRRVITLLGLVRACCVKTSCGAGCVQVFSQGTGNRNSYERNPSTRARDCNYDRGSIGRTDPLIDHPRSGVLYNFVRVCLSVCLYVCLYVRRLLSKTSM